MRKSLGLIAGAGLAALSMTATPATPTKAITVAEQQQQQEKALPVEVAAPKQRISINQRGGLDFAGWRSGLSPKEYGMYLQQRGRQKWNKRCA